MKPSLSLITTALLAGLLVGCSSSDGDGSGSSTAPAMDTQSTTPAAPTATTSTNTDEAQVEVVAVVNGEPIYRSDVDEVASSQGGAGDNPELRKRILEELISQKLVYQDAMSKGLEQDPEVAADMKLVRMNLLVTAAVKHAVSSNPVSEEELQAAYQELSGIDRGDEYKARHILVKERDEAVELIRQLDEGADFAELAKSSSIGPSGSNGGDLGWFNGRQMVEPFTQAVATMEPGSISSEPVETQFGWHVIQLEEKRPVSPPAFEEVSAALRSRLEQQHVGEYINKLKETAEITLH